MIEVRHWLLALNFERVKGVNKMFILMGHESIKNLVKFRFEDWRNNKIYFDRNNINS